MVKNDDGKVVFNGMVKTLFNGFFEIWLPRNQKYNLKIDYGGKSSEGTMSTFNNSKTCITTFKLI